jgi:hypothetical protein
MDIFETSTLINNLLNKNQADQARNELIRLLDYHSKEQIEYSSLVNHLIRQTGLYPYLDIESSQWQDRFIYDVFKVNIGRKEEVTLHKEQSGLLKKLLNGESIAVSAPTSFGKSFVIDAYIAIKRPTNIAIIVPTIALTDETRRRLFRKFSNEYKIITTSEVELGEKNIFIFPQERAINYINSIESLDLLVIDEFYKASAQFEKERSPALLKAILRLGEKSKQKYFLAPNISKLNDSPFTKGMEFLHLDFNTVVLEKYELYRVIDGDDKLKSEHLLKILSKAKSKSLIYAGTYSEISKITNLLIESIKPTSLELLSEFSTWLEVNYDANWTLTSLVRRGAGVHNGRLHRSLSQIQVKLFEEPEGLKNLVSTSSIIEGVNTSAENVIIWRNRNGGSRLNDFTYRNIIGRGGRMFKHFIGNIYILDEPPNEESTQLNLTFPDELVGDINENEFKDELTSEQISQIINYRKEMSDILGKKVFAKLQRENSFHNADAYLIKSIAEDMVRNPTGWNGLAYLNSGDPRRWDRLLFKMIDLKPSGWDIRYSYFVEFIKILSRNWEDSIPTMLRSLSQCNIDVESFFQLERNATFKLAALVHDVNILHQNIISDQVDISPFISRLSHAFLPSVVYQLEEYGLPRMISRKVHKSGIINFTDPDLKLHDAISILSKIGVATVKKRCKTLEGFDSYILDYFFEGITLSDE